MVYNQIDWQATEDLRKQGMFGFLVLKDGTRTIEHYITSPYETYSTLTRKRVDRWQKDQNIRSAGEDEIEVKRTFLQRCKYFFGKYISIIQLLLLN